MVPVDLRKENDSDCADDRNPRSARRRSYDGTGQEGTEHDTALCSNYRSIQLGACNLESGACPALERRRRQWLLM